MIKIKYLNLLVISQHYRVTIKEFIVIIFVSHTSLKTRNFWHKLRSAKARPHSVKTSQKSVPKSVFMSPRIIVGMCSCFFISFLPLL